MDWLQLLSIHANVMCALQHAERFLSLSTYRNTYIFIVMNFTSVPYPRRKSVINLSSAVALLCIAAPVFAQSQVELKPVEISGAKQALQATDVAPSQSSLEARSAQSIVSDDFIRNYTSPVADYTQALTMTPGVFGYTPNGVGLGDSKITMRGLSDSFMVISFDGIPFNDTNGVSHHSWAWFPSQTLGGAVVDRSPGSAATLGQATFAGNVDLRSRILEVDPRTSVMGSVGSWNTNVMGVEHQTGQFGQDGKSTLMFNVERTNSDGYQTFNDQHRSAYSAKYQYAEDATTTFTLFASTLDMTNHTGSITGVTRAQYNLGNYNYLNSDDPKLSNYGGYNFYILNTAFGYAGLNMALGNGWQMEDKVYRYDYTNHQKYDQSTATTPPVAVTPSNGSDKLNSYKTYGNVLRLTKASDTGILRTGLWLDNANSARYTVPSNPFTWAATNLPDYSELYTTTTIQPYFEYEYKYSKELSVTPGVKYASYSQKYTHLQDNKTGKGAVFTATTPGSTIEHSIEYSDVLPSLDVRYKLSPDLTVYGQYAVGDQIPSTSVFDIPNAAITVPPKPTKAATTQFGTVFNAANYTAAADVYYSELDSTYSCDKNTGVCTPSGTQYNQGIEAEVNFMLGSGFNLYMNATYGSLKYASDGKWVAGAPSDTETVGLTYVNQGWATGFNVNRVGTVYNDGKNPVHEGYQLDPVVLSNLFVNYTIKTPSSQTKQAKVQFAVNNVFDSHAITAVSAGTAGQPNTDVLTVLPGRSVNLTLTIDF